MGANDRAAELFRTTVVPHLADALALARWLTGSSHDAEDVVQEACIRAFGALGSYEGRGARAWLLSIVRNTSFTWLAKNRPSALILTGAPEETEAGLQEDPGPTPEAALIKKAEDATLAKAIDALAHPFREVLVLRDINELSYKEIAVMMSIPIGTVMSRLARARALLAVNLERAAP